MSGGFYNIDCNLYGGTGIHRINRNPAEMTLAEKKEFCEPGINTYRHDDLQSPDDDPKEPETKIDIDK